MSFYERYALCCKKRGVQPVSHAAAEYLHCSKSNISSLAKKGTTPNGIVVANAARMLDVSTDFLLGLIDRPQPIISDYSDTDQTLLNAFHSLNKEGQEAVLSMISGLLNNSSYRK